MGVLVVLGLELSESGLGVHAQAPIPQTPSPQGKAPFRSRSGYAPGKGPESQDRLQPKKDLKLTVARPERVGSNETFRHPWVQLTIQNVGQQTWYFSRSAEFYGMEIEVVGPDGRKLPLNARGIQRAVNALTSTPRRTVNLKPDDKETFLVALGDYLTLPPNQKYRVQIRWTVNMHPNEALRNTVGMEHDRGLSPTLESNIYEIDFRGQ